MRLLLDPNCPYARPSGMCHWARPDHEEVIEPGDAFYMSPGHVPIAEAGSEFVQFSPTEELRVVVAAMATAMQAMPRA